MTGLHVACEVSLRHQNAVGAGLEIEKGNGRVIASADTEKHRVATRQELGVRMLILPSLLLITVRAELRTMLSSSFQVGTSYEFHGKSQSVMDVPPVTGTLLRVEPETGLTNLM
jgi:hypothetical protein